MSPRELFLTGLLVCSAAIGHAAEIRVVLLDERNKTLGHGEATVIVRSVERGLTKSMPFYPDQGHYYVTVPAAEHLDVVVYTKADTQQRTLGGLSGHHDHKLFLRTDQPSMACRGGDPESGIPLAVIDLVNDLDEAYPDGVPRKYSNTRELLKGFALKAVDDLGESPVPEHAAEIKEIRGRILRHLK